MALNSLERKALSGLALLYATRMLGLFMVLPVLTLYGADLEGSSSVTLGLALGIYGITQAVLQIPFGAASDRFGRKPLILIGLAVFLIGSVISALSEHVYGVIFGRALQGAGAISSVVLAMLADYTREEERSKAMAIIGAVIGSSFVVAVMLGPLVVQFGGLSSLFWFTALLALVSMCVVLLLPAIPNQTVHDERKVKRNLLGSVFKDANVIVLSTGIFLLHTTMTALFVALPIVLVTRGFDASDLGKVYAPVMIIAFLGMAPMMMASEKRKAQVTFLKLAASMIGLSLALIAWLESGALTCFALWVFFVGFNFIEATLPSLLSRKVAADRRGTAMGVFATSQFLGAAFGGIAGGFLFMNGNILPIVLVGVTAQVIWGLMLFLVKPITQMNVKPEVTN